MKIIQDSIKASEIIRLGELEISFLDIIEAINTFQNHSSNPNNSLIQKPKRNSETGEIECYQSS